MNRRAVLLATTMLVGTLGLGSRAHAWSICDLRYSLQLPIIAQTLDNTCGAACFDSVLRYWFGYSPGEIPLALQLGTILKGRTDGYAIVQAANLYGLFAHEHFGATVAQLSLYLSQKETVYVGWQLEGTGHYSLVQSIGPDWISLMDPWHARAHPDEYNVMPLSQFLPLWYGQVIRISRWPLR